MTTQQLIDLLKSTIDEIGGIAPFYVDPDDYVDSLNEGQIVVFADLAGDVDAQLDRLPEMVVKETLTDSGTGVTLANRCYMPLSAHRTTGHHVTVKPYGEWLAYSGVTTNGFLQCTVKGDKLFTNPANKQVDFYYLRYPKTLVAGIQDPELDVVYHYEIWQQAIQILLRKDTSEPRTALIEAWRNRREMFRKAKAKRSVPEPAKFVPKPLPYQPK